MSSRGTGAPEVYTRSGSHQYLQTHEFRIRIPVLSGVPAQPSRHNECIPDKHIPYLYIIYGTSRRQAHPGETLDKHAPYLYTIYGISPCTDL